MKKLVSVLLTIVAIMMATSASANDDPIWENVYSWWQNANRETVNLFLKTEYGREGFVNNGTAYYASNNMSVYYNDFKLIPEIENDLIERVAYLEKGSYTVDVKCIGDDHMGRHVLEITINSEHDLQKIKETGFEDLKGPIYKAVLICYDRITVD